LVFAHGDFQAAHVFVQGDAVTGIIDWADSCQGDPLYDLAVLTVGHEERLADVLDGYGRDFHPDEDVIRGWWAFRRLAAVPWMVEHGYDAGGDVEALRRTVGA
jgi:aminoglycoside phosphotransferase (APT) family kinase protein